MGLDTSRLVERIRRASLVRVVGIYLLGSWAALEAIDLLTTRFGLPDYFFPVALGLLIAGLPVTVATAVIQALTVMEDVVPSGEATDPPAEGGAGLERWFTWRRAIVAGAIAFFALGSLGATTVWLRNRGRVLSHDTVAVMPFHVVADRGDLWREGLVDLLSTALDATGQFRASDPRAVINQWRAAVENRDQLAEPRVAAEVAGNLGASRVILGSLINIGGDRVRLSADLYSVRWLRKVGSASVEGSEAEITGLIDRLTLDLLLSVWEGGDVPEIHVSAMTTASIPALRFFLEGEQSFRRSQFADAQASFTAAVKADSTFAIAYYRLAQTYGWFLGLGASEIPRFLAAAERYSQGLSERDSLIIRAWKLADVDGSLRAIPLFEQLAARYADDMEIWYGLGDAYFHLGPQLGHTQKRAIPPFVRSLDLDSTFAPSLIHLIELAYYDSDTILGRQWTEQYLQLDTTSKYSKSFRILTPLLLGPSSDSAVAAQALDTADADLLGWMQARFRLFGSTLPLYEQVALAHADPRHDSEERSFALWSLGLRYLRHGQTALALDLFDRAVTLSGGDMRGPVLTVISTAQDLGLLADTTSERVIDELSSAMKYPVQSIFMGSHYAQERRFDEAQAVLNRVEAQSDSLTAAGDSAVGRSLRGLSLTLRGRIAAAQGNADSAIAHLRSGLPLVNATWTWQRDLARYWLANLMQDRGGEQEAINIYGSVFLNPWLEALGYFHRAELHERRGEREEALRYYGRFVELWEDADPHLQPRLESAKLAIDRLGGETRT